MYLAGDNVKGKKAVTETLQVFDTLSAPALVKLYQQYWRLFLKRNALN
ncbi:hypothetical protein HMPREF9104_01336 [Lentilactobacillus kisonensis F0435]|uniref:Uncharacterized protein n=1 Tax=Lentilactobacillus kisonensis F0435 TaxID=797516 RepID=H1LFG0_9LACO|nr:hypothetical protein HMPREF9104_01336 [Lentilactobacillus kisonensis F0435]